MRQIQLCGKTYNIGYNMQAAITYERLTGKKAFDLQQFQDGTIEPQLILGYSMLLACNEPGALPDIGELLKSITSIKDMQIFLESVAYELTAFYKTEAGDSQPKHNKKGNNSKNS